MQATVRMPLSTDTVNICVQMYMAHVSTTLLAFQFQ